MLGIRSSSKKCLSRGKFISMDSNREKRRRLDVARCLMRTTSMETINKVVQVTINDYVFNIKMKEEAFMCPMDLQSHKKSSFENKEDEEESEMEYKANFTRDMEEKEAEKMNNDVSWGACKWWYFHHEREK